MCVYDRIVNIFKKGINIFFKKGVFKGGHNVARGGHTKCCAPTPTQMLSYAPEVSMRDLKYV